MKTVTKKVLTFFLAVGLTASQSFAGGNLQSGTPVNIRLTNEISSGNSTSPKFVVSSDIKDANGNVLIKKDTPVSINHESTSRKAIGRPGKINIKFLSTTTTDGQIVRLDGVKDYQAKSKVGKVVGIAVGVGSFFLFPMYAYLAKKGDDVTVQPSEIYNAAVVVNEVTVK
jgi:hypothetical protein